MRRQPKPPEVPARPRNDTSPELMNGILASIRDMFYPRDTAQNREAWAKDQHLYRRNLVTWAAHWLDSRAVTLAPERFKKLLLDKLLDIKLKTRAEIKYLPKYLTHCIQDHFHHHGEEIYREAKSTTAALDNALARAQIAQGGIDPIRVLAMAHKVTKQPKKPTAKKDSDQLTLL